MSSEHATAADSELAGQLAASPPGALWFASYGLTVALKVDPPGLLDEVRHCLPPGWTPARRCAAGHLVSIERVERGAAGAVNRVTAGGELIVETASWPEALHCLESHLQLYVAEWGRQRIFVHAGVVGHRGKAILLPGRSFSGKSTLVAALLKAGAEYLSDEYAVLDPAGQVHPYPRRLSMRADDGSKVRRMTAEDFCSRTCLGPLPVGLVAVTRYSPGRTRLASTSRGWAAMAMIKNTIPIRSRPGPSLEVIQRSLADALCLRGKRGDAKHAAEWLISVVSDREGHDRSVGATNDKCVQGRIDDGSQSWRISNVP
jgi:hypothetical protein